MELYDMMESSRRRQEQEMRRQISMLFVLAESTAEHVGCYLNSENKARLPWDFYPELFAAEKAEYEKTQAAEQAHTARENRKAYAAELKRRREMGLV